MRPVLEEMKEERVRVWGGSWKVFRLTMKISFKCRGKSLGCLNMVKSDLTCGLTGWFCLIY